MFAKKEYAGLSLNGVVDTLIGLRGRNDLVVETFGTTFANLTPETAFDAFQDYLVRKGYGQKNTGFTAVMTVSTPRFGADKTPEKTLQVHPYQIASSFDGEEVRNFSDRHLPFEVKF